jgi:hypothetical protein
VTAVTLLCDEGYSGPSRLGASFELNGGPKMQEDARDLLEVFKFDLIEATIGSWLRAVIQRLEQERMSIRRNHNEEHNSNRGELTGTAR